MRFRKRALEIAYLDPDLNAEGEHLHVHVQAKTIWDNGRQFVRSPCVATMAVLSALLVIAANLS